MMKQNNQYEGGCFCGSVQFSLSGEPEAMAYCHCDSCRHWSAGPVSAFTLWRPEMMKITQGEKNIASFDKNPGTDDETLLSKRQWCDKCGGHICTDHPAMGLIDVPAVLIRGLKFNPGFHVHYQESVFPVKDGLPKFKDLPAAAGGSGDEMAE
jgi:hypothetical protein